MAYLRSSCSDEGLHQHQLRSLSRSWRSHPWSSGAQRQHCPQATVLFFWTANLCPPPPPHQVSFQRLLQWNCAELSLQQPWKISSSSDGGISGNLRYTGALSNLDGNLDEFRAWCPASSSDVLWNIPLLIGCRIPISTTSQNFSSIRPSKLREPSD